VASSPHDPFETSSADAARATPEPLPDIPAADVMTPAPLGPLVEVASATTVISAEMLRSRLVGAGIRAALRDQFVVGTDPLLTHAVDGVKVVVGQHDAERALALLAEPPKTSGPVFRVERTSMISSVALGLIGGSAIGAALGILFGPLALPLCSAVGALVGAKLGARVERHCSSCQAALTVDLATCPRCGGRIAGVLSHPDERLAAEERLRETSRTPD
jgi:hypothetical protein